MKILSLPILLSSLLIVVLMTSCASERLRYNGALSSQRMNYLSVGMTKQEVISVLGMPVSSSAPEPEIEVMHYNFATDSNPGQFRMRDYVVILRSGKVSQYGKKRSGTTIINGKRIYTVE